jgi:hypothetical protein
MQFAALLFSVEFSEAYFLFPVINKKKPTTMSSGTVLPGICAVSGPWTFVASTPSAPIQAGVYTAQYNGGSYLAKPTSGTAVTMVPTVDPATCYWYMSSYLDAGSGSTFLAVFPAQSIDPLSQTLTPLLYIADPGKGNCAASLNLGSTTSDPPVMTNGIYFGVDPEDLKKQSIYSPGCSLRYIPSSDGKTLVPTQDADTQSLWQFTQVTFPVPTTGLLPTSQFYYVQWNFPDHGGIYITDNQSSAFGFSDTYDFAATQLNVNGALAFSCSTNSPMQFNPASIFYATSATSAGSVNAKVTATTSEIYVDGGPLSGFQVVPYCRKQGGVAGITSIIVPPIFSIITSSNPWTYQVTSIETTGLTSLPSGNYTIQYGSDKKWCLQADGSLGLCSTAAPIWTYNSDTQQLNTGANYLKAGDPKIVTCGPFHPFEVTTNSQDGDTRRFFLTTNNKLYDSATGLCYSSSVELNNFPRSRLYDVFRDAKQVLPWTIIIVVSIIVLLTIVTVIGHFVKKRRPGG